MIKNIFSIIFLLAIALTCALPVQAQQRVDKVMPVFIKKSEPLTKAKGYCQNGTSGKWIENDNVISDREVEPADSGNRAYTGQNIYWFRTATVGYGGKKYYAFYYYYLAGQCKPQLGNGGRFCTATKFMLVDSADYFTFKKAVLQKKGETLNLRSRIFNTFPLEGEYDEDQVLASMAKEIGNQYPTGTDCLPASTQTLDGKDIARFRIFANCLFSKYFSTEYFEVSYDDLKKLFVE